MKRLCECGCGESPKNWKAKRIKGHDDRRVRPLADRLWEKVDRTGDGCWEWQEQSRRVGGYGQIGLARGKAPIGAHRAAWIVTYGEIPPGMFVCHACDNPPCCRPDHLFLGTAADNSRDCGEKGRRRFLRGDDHPKTRLTDDQVREIRQKYRPAVPGRRSNVAALAREYGQPHNTIYLIAIGRRRTL